MRRIVLCLVALSTLAAGCAYRYETRDFNLEIPQSALSSFIFDGAGNQLALLRTPENRVYKRLDEIPKTLQNAVVAIEDERFWLHKGYDLKGLIRSARSNVSAGGVNQGASTITQQYVGNVFLDRNEKTAKRKLQEIALARQFEQKYTKEFILEKYLNWVFLGNGANGVQAAAKTYFNKDVGELTLPEAALIAGLIQQPSKLNPFKNPDGAKKRRNQVLDRMLVNGYITENEYKDAATTPVLLKEYVPITEERYEAGHFVEDVKKWFLSNPAFGETEQDRQTLLFEGGLKIYTTIDMDLQRAAEQARDEVLPDVAGLDAAVVTMDPTNGHVLAMVGGRDFFGTSPYAKVNLADGDGRQTGSSIKAVALAAALQSGWDPTRTYTAPSTIELKIPNDPKPWSVRGGAGGAQTTLIEATRRSLNTVYAQMILDLGPQKLTDMAAKLGIKHPVAPIPAAVLGTENVTMLDMATAFSAFAARGLERDPVMVTKIVRSDGTTLYEHHDTQTRVLDTKIADQLNWILSGVISGGTGTAAKFGRPAAGKTGSAQNNADATFIGYTPQRTTAVWVGFPEGQVPMVPPRTPISVFGGTYPARIFSKVMSAAHKDLPTVDFADPPPSSTTTTTTILGPAAPVPNVQGQSADQAKATLEAAGFGVTITNVETDEFTPGLVSNQAPKAGTEAPAGSKVTIEVATAPAQRAPITVPNVIGLSRADARGRLLSGGFSVLEVFETAPPGTSPAPASGVVWRQAPVADSPKPADGVVQISIQP